MIAPAEASVLHPEHLEDLRRSGLTDGTIAEAGIRTLDPEEWRRYLPEALSGKILSALWIPYPDGDSFGRVRLFPPVANGDGHAMKYYQKAGSAPQLYLPPLARAALTDPTVRLAYTEGEKKCLAADQAGVACVGLGGLWNWLQDGKPIADLGRVDHVGRAVLIVPDSDVWTRDDLLHAVYALGKELESRGATVEVVKLPAGSGGTKQGLDDYLLSHSAEALHALPRLGLKDAPLSRLANWWKSWTARKAAAPESVSAIALLERGETVRHLHPAQDVVDGVLWYGVPTTSDQIVMVNSDRQAVTPDTLPRGLALRHTGLRESSVSRNVALAWTAGEPGSVATTLDRLAAFVTKYIVLGDPRTALLLAAWLLGTWVYRAFRVFPYLSIRSPEKRCGKSRLLVLLRLVAFNSGPITAAPTEAQLYRGAAATGGAQLFDEIEGLRGDKERMDALIAVLNVGFERGGIVSRQEKRGDKFEEVRYETYCPRALAGIAALKETLADRSIPIFMTRKRRDEPVARLTGIDPEANALRESCALACLSRIADILTAAEQVPGLLACEQVDDRASDLWGPLVAVGLVGDAEDGGTRARTLLDLARDLGGLRDADQDDGRTARLLDALVWIGTAKGNELSPEDVRSALAERAGFAWVKSTRSLAGLLNPLGVFRERRREGAGRRYIYRLDPATLADLQARYGGSGDPA